MIDPKTNQKGYVLILTLVMSAVFLSIGLSIGGYVSARYQSSKRTAFVENAILAADAGVTDTLNTLIHQRTFTGFSTKKLLYSEASKGKAAYTTGVSYDATTKLYTITSTGYVYRSPSDDLTQPFNTKSVEVTTALASSSVAARMAVGPGGLTVASGKIGGKNIYVNGRVTMTGGSFIGATGWGWIGPQNDTSINVANYGCGDASNYPIKCTGPMPGSGEPIQQSNDSIIYGTACANDQTTGTNIYPGQSGLGLVVNCHAPVAIMPTYDRQALYNSMTQTLPGYTCTGWYPNNPYRDLVGNTIYSSSVSLLNGEATCNNKITGNVYIRGNLTVSGFGRYITVADNDALGNPITTPPIVAVEGTITFDNSNNPASVTPNIHGVGAIFISFRSSNAACNASVSCNTLSTADLYSSVPLSTVVVSGDMNASSSVFYSYFGTTDIQNGTVGAVAGQRVLVSSDGDFSGFVAGGVHKDSFPGGDAFGGKVQIPVWNIITYRQTFP